MTKQRLLGVLTLGMAMAWSTAASAQHAAFKTNLLYDASTTPNIGLEFVTGKKQTAQLVYGLNPWDYTSRDGKAKHWVVMPEYRWWMCSRMNGHFVGVHGLGGQFNAEHIDFPFFPGYFFRGENLVEGVKDFRYQGWFAGGGFTYGYQWILSRHWNLEAEIGVGYAHVWYDKYRCRECGSFQGTAESDYVGLTKLGLSLMYVF